MNGRAYAAWTILMIVFIILAFHFNWLNAASTAP